MYQLIQRFVLLAFDQVLSEYRNHPDRRNSAESRISGRVWQSCRLQ
ncbi:hypothetical protein CLOLEP_02584 [[Clostridium] leptum DSM 753]|uniref:Uncharacterized protein n=1 Tax=[Clostridium] leptum DSM 753 TaxID=428125 RepID=A7VVH3_9FIRM|nr:hypothetical protein CLOLEP_02584 [[Clostridium] leptum DSM 753]